MLVERAQHRQQRRISLRDRVVVFGHGRLDLVPKTGYRPVKQLEIDDILAGEVEVDSALGCAGLAGDLINACVPKPLAREDSQGGV